jgi:hypothetical protein
LGQTDIFWQDGGNSPIRWRLPFGINAIPPILLFSLLPFLPEPPRFLIRNDQHNEAREILAKVRTENGDIDDPLAVAEFNEIMASVAESKRQGINKSYG